MKDTFECNITYLRLFVTDSCNLRCRYCMPEEGICKKQHEEMLNEDEIEILADLTRKYPVDVRFIELMPMYGGMEQMRTAILSRPKCHGGLSYYHRSEAGCSMNRIGG